MFKEVIALEESMSDDIRNVIIIGSGPAGYTAGLYTSRAMLEPLMFAGYMSGGQLMLTSDIENFPGYPEGIGGPEMMMQLREQAERFGLEVQDRNVERVDLWNSIPHAELNAVAAVPEPVLRTAARVAEVEKPLA